MSDFPTSEEPRPIVDLSQLSLGSLRRYQALYGIVVDQGNILEGVKSHFGSVVYSMMKPNTEKKPLPFKPPIEITVQEDPHSIEVRETHESIEHFLKIKKDDKEESGLRKSTRKREKVEKKF